MGPPPVVTGISPKEATAGTKITIRGENLGSTPSDLLGVNILGEPNSPQNNKCCLAHLSQNIY